MKTKLLVLFLLGLTTSIFSQWQMVDSSKTNVINDFVDGGKYLFVAGGQYITANAILKRSSDDGSTWQKISNGLSSVISFNQVAGVGEEIYLQSTVTNSVGNIFRSTDGGLSWARVSNGPVTYTIMELLYDGTTLLAFLNNEFQVSLDNGKTWSTRSKISSIASLKGLVTDGTRYYSYSPALNGYYYSEDKCTTWKQITTPNSFMTSFSTDGKNIYMIANDANQTPYMLTDFGKTLITGKLVGGIAYSVDRISGVGNAVFASGQVLSNYIYLSLDQMKSWTNVSDGIPAKDYHIEKILIKGSYIYLAFNSISVSTPSYQIWRRKLSDFGIATAVQDNKEVPTEFKLMQNYPNPFNPSTTISYKVQTAGKVTLKVFDVLGREVATLVDEVKQPGVYHSNFSTSQTFLSSGIYFYTLKANNYSSTKKMILAK